MSIFLSLDATAVLLTPAVVALVRRVGAPATPLVLATVYDANTGSVLLPVSNLTNVVVADRLHGGATSAGAMWPAQVAALAALWLLLAVWHRRALSRPLPPRVPGRGWWGRRPPTP